MLTLGATQAEAQLTQKCVGESGFTQLATWLGGPNGRGGRYASEFCAMVISKYQGDIGLYIQANGKDATGSEEGTLKCLANPVSYKRLRGRIDFHSDDAKWYRMALQNAAKYYC